MKTISKRKLLNYGFVMSLLAVALANFAIFFVYINFDSIMLAFQVGNGEFGLDNFRMLFADFANPLSVINQALKNTMIFFAFSMLVQFPLSVLLSYFIFRKIPLYKFFRVVFFLPSLISAVVLVNVYTYTVQGPLTDFLSLFMEDVPYFFSNSDYTLWMIVIFVIWSGFGINILLFSGAMSRVPIEVIEYGRMEGVGFFQELILIMIPLVWPTMSTVIVLGCVGIFNSSGPILLFTQGRYDTYTISYWIYEQTMEASYEYASAVGLFFTCVGLPIVLCVRWLTNKVLEDVEY